MRNFTLFAVSFLLGICMMMNPSQLQASTDSACCADSAPAPDKPQDWVLLEDKPRLWKEPAGSVRMPALAAKALDTMLVIERKEAGKPAAMWLRVLWPDGKGNTSEGWLPEAMLARKPVVTAAQLNDLGAEPVDRAHGIPPDYEPPDLVTIQNGFEKERVYKLRREAAESLDKLINAAKTEGIKLAVVSAYRSHETQRSVYSKKLTAGGWNQTTVAKPGHSEHQLGTAVDFTDGDHTKLLEVSFGETDAGKWLLANAPKFGFAISYTPANQPMTGYSPEPWHYRYYGEKIAQKKHKQAIEGK